MSSAIRNAILLLSVLGLTGLLSGGPATATVNESHPYDMPSSFVIRGIFGFGVLVCDQESLEALHGTVRNGPCIDYEGYEGTDFLMSATDVLPVDPSITITVDVDGDGCVSGSCGDRDYRVNGCGAAGGTLPFVDDGAKPIMKVYVRAFDVDPATGAVCSGTNGVITIEYGV
ncbi:MAG: hypothetical protein KY455_09320 [Euryarchaeota archaeon]|nr:hypothetical protein [Euryarchaeota archaeon]